MIVDSVNFDAYACPSPDQAMAAIPKLALEMLMVFDKGGEAGFEQLKAEYRIWQERMAPPGTRAGMFASIIWKGAEEKARGVQLVIRCRGCGQKNRQPAHRSGGVCGKCKAPLHKEDAVT